MDEVGMADILEPHVSLKWVECFSSSLPQGMMDVQAVWLNDRYYVTLDDRVFVRNAAELYIYTPTLHNWEKLHTPVNNFAVTAYKCKLVLVGGRKKNGERSDKILVLQEDGEWLPGVYHPMPMKRRSASVICEEEHLVVAGGCGDQGPTDSVDVYDGETWTPAEPLPQPCYLMKSILHDGTWYLMGGRGQKKEVYYTSLKVLIATAKDESKRSSVWNKLPDVPLEYSSPAIFGRRLIATGPHSSDVYAYSHSSIAWERVKTVGGGIPEILKETCTLVLPSGELMVVGKVGDSSSYRTYKGYASVNNELKDLKMENTQLKQHCALLLAENQQLKGSFKKLKDVFDTLQCSGLLVQTECDKQELGFDDHGEVTFFLETMEDKHLIKLGEALGLYYHNLKRMENILSDMTAAWLRGEDSVPTKTGQPSWNSLAKALKKIGQTGMAVKVPKTNGVQA